MHIILYFIFVDIASALSIDEHNYTHAQDEAGVQRGLLLNWIHEKITLQIEEHTMKQHVRIQMTTFALSKKIPLYILTRYTSLQ